MSAPTTGLLATVVASLEEHETRHQLGHGSVSFTIATDRAAHAFFVSADEDTGIVVCVVSIGPHVPDERRIATAEAIARINSQLGLGHFELDFDDGELRYRSTIDVEGGLFASTMFDNIVRSALWACDGYVGVLMAVAFGNVEPVIAVAAVAG